MPAPRTFGGTLDALCESSSIAVQYGLCGLCGYFLRRTTWRLPDSGAGGLVMAPVVWIAAYAEGAPTSLPESGTSFLAIS